MTAKEVAGYRNRISSMRGMGATKSAARLVAEFSRKIAEMGPEELEWVAHTALGMAATTEDLEKFLSESA